MTMTPLKRLLELPLPFFTRVLVVEENFGLSGFRFREAWTRLLIRGVQIAWWRRADLTLAPAAGCGEGDPADWRADGIRLLDVATYAICVELEKFPHEWNLGDAREREVVVRRCREAAALVAAGVAVLARFKPRRVAYFQGHTMATAVMRRLAIRRGIGVLALEIVANKERLLWENVSGIAVNRNLARNFFWRHREEIDGAVAHSYAQDFFGRITALKHQEHQSPETQWLAQSDAPLVVYIGQVFTDSSVLFGLEGRTPVDVMAEVAECCRRRGYRLMIKLHPKEHGGLNPLMKPYDDLTWRRMQQVPVLMEGVAAGWAVVDWKNEYNTYSIMRQAGAVVTVNSQAGLEAAVLGKPVVLAGTAFYGGCGFTEAAPDGGGLAAALDKALAATDAESRRQTAEKFFFCFYERYCVVRSLTGVSALMKEGGGPNRHGAA